MLRRFKERHKANPYDLIIVFNLKGPQIACANYAMRRCGLPVILEYEDDKFVNVGGETVDSFVDRLDKRAARGLVRSLAACVAVSPHLLSQLPSNIPTLLLRGVVGADLLDVARSPEEKKNIVLFAGTHIQSNGVAELIEAWREVGLRGWELHITGYGQLTESLRTMAQGVEGIVFHGLVGRPELLALMCTARICVNPHQVSRTPGNVFAFKIIEYLAAGAHVVTTPMGALEKELEAGITYMPDNSPTTIAATLCRVAEARDYKRTAMRAAADTYGPAAVSKSLNALLEQVRGKN
jgi:glycosyltransferase involved in cell wall biosynthesis